MNKKQLITLGLVIIAVIGIPATVLLFNQQQENRSRAEKSTILSFTPTSSDTTPIMTSVGDTLALDTMIKPGTNAVSQIKLEMVFDASKFDTGTSTFEPNAQAFPQTVENLAAVPGKMTITLSIGVDATKVIQSETRIGTLKLKALSTTTTNETTTSVTFGQGSVVSVLEATPAGENVLASSQPAIIAVGFPPEPTCAPRPSCLDETPKCLVPEPAGGWCPVPTPTSPPLPTPQDMACRNASTDTVLIFDISGSMNGSKFTKAKEAAKIFIDKIAADPGNRVALVSFASNATLNISFTSDFNAVKSKIDGLRLANKTCIQCGINKANDEIASKGRQDIKKVAVLLTDGRANAVNGQSASTSTAENAAIEAAKNGFNAGKTVFFTIGLGADVSASVLTQIATLTGGKYYTSPTETQLAEIYTQISQVSTKGSVSGFVYYDVNKSGTFDPSESKLSGWTLELMAQGATSPQQFGSNSEGAFNIANLCDGAYSLKQVVKSGWEQTTPVSPAEYTINITGGTVVTDKNFGNFQAPAATPTPQATTLFINGLIDGVGSRGDNSNPDGSLSNKNPLHPTRNVIVTILNPLNQPVMTTTGILNYSAASGMFSGKVAITQPLTTGSYSIKATTDGHLTRLLPGIQTITAQKNNQLPNAIFVAGDIVNDNKLDIRDYNSLIDCYSDLVPATACDDAQKKTASDLNDDGGVNQFDYNLLLREIATQPGE